jgi:hypothetical protein
VEIWVYRNNGAFGFTQFNVESAANLGLQNGGLAWADFNATNSLDFLASGSDNGGARQMRIYQNQISTAVAPAAPATLAASFAFGTTGFSTATFKWDPGTDSGAGATPANTLTYDLEVSTLSSFARETISMASTATPRLGNYFRPLQIYDGNTRHGAVLRSTQPWAGNNAHPGLLTDTTYYFRVRTIDAGLLQSAPSASQTVWTGVPPTTSTLVAVAGSSPGDIVLTWTAPGDDMIYNNLSGNYRIQYSSNAATLWSTSTTPSGAYTTTFWIAMFSTRFGPGLSSGTALAGRAPGNGRSLRSPVRRLTRHGPRSSHSSSSAPYLASGSGEESSPYLASGSSGAPYLASGSA